MSDDINKIDAVGIVVKPNHEEAWNTACELAEWLKARGIKALGRRGIVDIAANKCLIEPADDETISEETGLIVVLGGDGTMISVARLTRGHCPLILGINYGSLGYLTDFRIEEMFPALEVIFAGEFEQDQRVMLDAEHWRGDDQIARGRVLNDVVVNKAALARIIEIDVRMNGQFVNHFRADGLIISTPTGSTAYNLSAGGPIIYPSMNALVLTPICPFTLTNRPTVVPDDVELEITLANDIEGVVLTLDGQIGHELRIGDKVIIKKSKTTFNLVQPANRNYFDVLRNKLQWGR